jgi:hypothetical protein
VSASAVRLRLVEAEAFERPVKFRIPFKFGSAIVREAPQAFIRVRIALDDGRTAQGISADLMVPKWFDKSPDLTNEQNFDQLRRALIIAREHLLGAGSATAFGLSAAVEATHHAACAKVGLDGLVASFGLALYERAIIDALGRLLNASVFSLVRQNALGLDSATAPDLDGFALDDFLKKLSLAPSIAARHTVGMIDALTTSDLDASTRLNDGLPETLEQAIDAYGHTTFKLKTRGDVPADIDRLVQIAEVLDRKVGTYLATIDGNEQFPDVETVAELWSRIGQHPRLTRLRDAILFIEQPIARAQALSRPLGALGDNVPLEIDESDADIGAFLRGRALGYRGISSKSCKGFYRALLNRARVAQWNAEAKAERFFMSAEDLTTQAGVAVQQDLALASLIGLTHIERNGHHYVDGMAGASQDEQDRFLTAHPDLYRRAGNRARLNIHNGKIQIGSLTGTAGLAVGAMPDFSTMQAMRGAA